MTTKKEQNEKIDYVKELLKKCEECYKKDFIEQVKGLETTVKEIESKFTSNSKVIPIVNNDKMEQEINTSSATAYDLNNLFVENKPEECQDYILEQFMETKKYFDECEEKYEILSDFYKTEYKENKTVADDTINHYYVYFSHITSQINFYKYRIRVLSREITDLIRSSELIESMERSTKQIKKAQTKAEKAREEIIDTKKKIDDSETRIITNSLIFMSLLATIITIISFVISTGNSLLNKESDQWTIAIAFSIPALVIIISIIVFFNLFYHLFYKEKYDADEITNPSLKFKKKGTLIITYVIFGCFVVGVVALLVLGFIFK